MTNRAILSAAKQIADDLMRQHDNYLATCEEWRREGYRPQFCEHGTSLWTDYDPICEWCENGVTFVDGVTRRRAALYRAHNWHDDSLAILKAYMAMPDSLRKHCDWSAAMDEVARRYGVRKG